MRLFFSLCLLMALPFSLIAQAINNTIGYKDINADGYFRLNYENDYFSARDQYYTQGFVAEVVHPVFSKSFLRHLFPSIKNSRQRVGIAFEHDAYTATSINQDSILRGDRPFTAALMLKPFSISSDSKQRLTAALSMGVIGSAAGGNEVQTSIHEWTGNIIPKGWQNQIANDVIVNYQLGYERNLVSINNYFLINADAIVYAGTLNDKASIGTTLATGYFQSPFDSEENNSRFNIYIYDRPAFNAIAYDATLQGGLFNKSSRYVISPSDISRFRFENRAGIVISYKSINVEYFQAFSTKEFITQKNHRWGGIQLALKF